MDPTLQEFIAHCISLHHPKFISIGGGSINQTFRVETSRENFFCKTNSAKTFPGLFEKEKNGLLFLQNCNAIRVPEVVWCGEHEGMQVLILEWIEQGLRTGSFWKKFGEQLAMLHRWPSDRDGQTAAGTAFGFHEDNYMGALPQINKWTNDWIEFFIHCRFAVVPAGASTETICPTSVPRAGIRRVR